MRGVIAGIVALGLALAAQPAAASIQDPAIGLRPVGAPLRIVVVPIDAPGDPAPGGPRLRREAARWGRLLRSASSGRIRLEPVIAPPFAAGALRRDLDALDQDAYDRVLDTAAARGVPVDGALPIYVAPGLRIVARGAADSYRSTGFPALGVLMISYQWKLPDVVVHELGHALGLDHSGTPACPHGRDVCRHGDVGATTEYADRFSLMGTNQRLFGGFDLARLGVARITDAERGVTAIRPAPGRDPTLLRLRTARRDWIVERRTSAKTYVRKRPERVARGVIASYSRSRYLVDNADRFPRVRRYPRTVARSCRSGACLGRFVYRPGDRLRVPGVFALRVLRGGGPVRVRTTWLDRSPPTLDVRGVVADLPPGGPAELSIGVRARARGAGVLAAEIRQGTSVTRIPADTVPGLAAGRAVTLHPAVAAGVPAEIRVVDAAGNGSPLTPLAVPAPRPGARVAFDPPAGRDVLTAPRLGGPLTVTGATDPVFAGLAVDVEIVGDAGDQPPLTIAPDGTFALTWTPPRRQVYIVRLRVPVEREPDGFNLRRQVFEGQVRR